ncbi:MAG: hypothetical protein QXU18_01240 [Thermoplasmatales archaeon]
MIKELRKLKMHHIVPLGRNSTMVPGRVKFDSAFAYNGKPMQSFKRSSRIGYIYMFQDPMMRAGGIVNTPPCCGIPERHGIL